MSLVPDPNWSFWLPLVVTQFRKAEQKLSSPSYIFFLYVFSFSQELSGENFACLFYIHVYISFFQNKRINEKVITTHIKYDAVKMEPINCQIKLMNI